MKIVLIPLICFCLFATATSSVFTSGVQYGVHDNITFIQGIFDTPVSGSVQADKGVAYVYSYDFYADQQWTSYVCVSSNAAISAPLIIVIRQSVSVLSWEIPTPNFNHPEVCHTLCPLQNYIEAKVKDGPQEIYVYLTTSSKTAVTFDLSVMNLTNFLIGTNEQVNVTITPSKPRVFEYHMPSTPTKVNSVLVEAHSEHSECTIMAIQDIQCPFYDSGRNVEYKGFYQTMTKQSGITVTRNNFKSGKVYVVMILKPTDEDCTELRTIEPSGKKRTKDLMITISPSITEKDIYIATFGAFGFFILLYIFSFIICIFLFYRHRKLSATGPELQNVGSRDPSVQSYGAVSASSGDSEASNSTAHVNIYAIQSPVDQVDDVDETDYDKLPEVERDKDIIRTRTVLYVSDLSKKHDKALGDKTKVYSWNLLTVAVFYGLPVVQLVYLNQSIVNRTGNQDLCYYNFLCSHQLWVFSDFNHVYSNIGYVMLGLLFLLLVWRREITFIYLNRETAERGQELTGIPHHFGLFYAMAIALVMEGILSASYHVCPNKANFQFDTAFMYVIATVCMLKLYQARHPDITAKSHHTWMILAVVLLIGVAGVLQGGTVFWIVYVFGHVTIVFIVSFSIYYMGRWSIDRHVFVRMAQTVKLDYAARSIRPTYPGRFIMLSIAVILNISLDLFGLIKRPSNFAAFLLSVFIMNLLLYLIYYTLMKVRYKERLRWIPIMYIILSFACWAAALNYFLAKSTSWKMTPALSRERNRPCSLFNFFDYHDIWHFFSSCALFFSFMVLFTLDDDLENTPRSKIIVF